MTNKHYTIFQRHLKKRLEKFRRLTEHTHCGNKLDYEVACFLAPREGLELQASVVPSQDWKSLSHSTCSSKSSLVR
ncbi:MAG: hypothetical protein H7A23_00045 [Leptospiraceae bacterium]|nr:hypothetical protein [Leptospiraceae bacterium]